jgi:FAD dependent oxidoreductase TIGR03364
MVQRLIAYMVEQMSLEYRPNTLVVGAEGGNTRVLLWDTADHFFGATRAVICNGRDFKALYPEVFERSEIQLVKLQMMQTVPVQVQLPVSVLTGLTIRRYESFAECSSWPLDRSHLDPRLQEWGIHILFKQAVDGSLVIGDSHEYASVVQADSLGFELRADINNLILAEAKKILDLPSWEIATTWAGYYSQHPDGVFQKEVEPGIHVITAIGGKGMTCSPALAGEHIGSMFNLD